MNPAPGSTADRAVDKVMDAATHVRHPLDIQRCAGCGAYWALRPYACAACGSTALRWHRAKGEGVVIARSKVHRAPDAAWRALVPYVLVLVQLREQVTCMGHAAPEVVVGQAVAGRVIEIQGRPLLEFALLPHDTPG